MRYRNHDLGARSVTVRAMVDHVQHHPGTIVETGTAGHPANWHSDGNSTLIWSDLGMPVISIDINPEHIANAKEHVGGNVTFVCGDSVEALGNIDDETAGRITLLYLDTCWSPSGDQALRELQQIWNRLPRGCLVAIDDRYDDSTGKHVAVEAMMKELGIDPVFKAYQIGWLKP